MIFFPFFLAAPVFSPLRCWIHTTRIDDTLNILQMIQYYILVVFSTTRIWIGMLAKLLFP